MEKLVCDENKCTGCKACLSVCNKNALIFHDCNNKNIVEIDATKCINCNRCKNVCQVNNPVTYAREPILWKQGWANESIRKSSSSGGFASQIMREFIGNNSYVCSCIFKDGRFIYYITKDIDELYLFKGSKYIKSDPEKIYLRIKELLLNNNRVLFIGLPCHIAGLKNILNDNLNDNLYTIDLICHGTPSPNILSDYLSELGYNIFDLHDIRFRENSYYYISLDNKNIVPKGVMDSYSMGFLSGLFYTENCYNCMYAQNKRISDITIGDSWGSDLIDEEKQGISIALCQTEKGKQLLLNSGLALYDVDIEKAIKSNHQLNHPSKQPANYYRFFTEYKKRKSVNMAVFKCLPRTYIKQKIKSLIYSIKNAIK